MKKYTKPTVISQHIFEVSALACLKASPGDYGHLGTGTTYVTGSGTIGAGTFHIGPGFSSESLDCSGILLVS